MTESHWRVVATHNQRLLIDRNASGTTWEDAGTYQHTWYDLAFGTSGELYGITKTGRLRLIDLDTQTSTLIGNTKVAGANALVIDALGNAYMSSDQGGFYTLDLATGDAKKVSDILVEGQFERRSYGDLEFFAGNLWLSSWTPSLVRIDPKTGEASADWQHGIDKITGLTNSKSEGFLGYSGNSIYKINVATREITKIGEFDAAFGDASGAAAPIFEYRLSEGVKKATLPGNADVTVYGNDLSNTIRGNAGANKLLGAAGKDKLYGAGGRDTINGGGGNDSLIGGSGNDVLNGGGGHDRLLGGRGNDTLKGGKGNDLLVGGAGKDKMSGGPGADTFRFLSVDDSTPDTRDVIRDFQRGLDVIDLAKIDAKAGTPADNAFKFIGGSNFSGTAGELRFKAGVLSGDVDGDRVADFQVEIAGVAKLGLDDFIL